GELYIGGVGLARGYLNSPGLTAEKFIANPFQSEEENIVSKNTRIYKTGDLVRWLPEGNLEYIGRDDFQVKIRGYRIELGEIESILSSYEGIKQSVVLIRGHLNIDGTLTNSKYLVGYYVSELKLDEDDILNYLQTRLPEYMVPSILVYLNELPLTINGKLDRKALPDPKFGSRDNYVAPRNEIEKKVCQIWSEVLGLAEDKVGIRDDFFRLGGDSIISIRLVSRLRQNLALNLSVKNIFDYKSIERIYENVLSKQQSINTISFKTEHGILDGEVPLLPIQEWFFERNFAVVNYWNQSFVIKTSNLDLDKLQSSIDKLVQHHDSFRLRYRKDQKLHKTINDSILNNNYVQYYDSSVKVEKLKILDIRTLKSQEGSKKFEIKLQNILTEWQSNFNIEKGPVYAIGYIYGYNDGSSRIVFALHHLIVDTVSWRVLIEDLRNIYNQKDLGPKGSSYRQWVNAVKKYANTHKNEEDYWINLTSDYNNQLNKLILSENTLNYANLALNQKLTQQLIRETNKAYNTQINDILLTALGYALFEFTGSKINHVILEGHGREEIDSTIDITRTVGWFTTMYPVRLEIKEKLDDSIKNIKETLRQVPNKGIGYGVIVGYMGKSLPEVSFNYLGQFNTEETTDNLQIEINSTLQLQNWDIVNENSGAPMHLANQNYNTLTINGLVIEGSLQFSIASKLGQNITDKIAKIFKQKL
ncbi:MAG: gramicidin biosynthesis protein, partial [Alphaproteobacteria bacterium]|nr:gramicidin biosynthesis protein [Alphaproteobacteria bacterium]